MIKGIIVEGCDCAGKSTLIQALKGPLSHSGWDITVLGHREASQFDRYMNAYANANKVIFDRGHFSEIVYNNLWRGGNALSSWEQSFLESYVFENFLTIFVKVPTEILKNAINQETTIKSLQNKSSKLFNQNLMHYYHTQKFYATKQQLKNHLMIL